MKKIFCLCLCLVLVLGLCACGGETETTAPAEFRVGYGRVDLSPSAGSGVSLVGYGGNGTLPTKMTGVLDPIYGTCVAVTDTEGTTVLIYTLDTLYTLQSEVDEVRSAITELTGVPGTNVIISSTHTHSSVRFSSIVNYVERMAQAAADAIADQESATIQAGKTTISGMNFVRHYYTEKGVVVGNNFDAATKESPRVKHTTEADAEMPMIRFVREGEKKDILLVNWQAHPKVASTAETASGIAQRSLLSADFVGFCRKEVEENTDCLFAYFNGASGNLNPRSDLPAERSLCSEKVHEYGAELGNRIIAALKSLENVNTGKVTVQQQKLAVTPVAAAAASQMELTTIRIGDIGFASVPFEMFDTNGMQIKTGSNCTTTFVLSCASMPEHEYIPAEYVWDYDTGTQTAYELRACKHERGTAEKVADALVGMLNDQGNQ